jgi:hypothetical protein
MNQLTVPFYSRPKENIHLQALDGAKDRLHLFKASLLEEGSFDSAIAGCECVFHTASPFYHNVQDPKVSITVTMFVMVLISRYK